MMLTLADIKTRKGSVMEARISDVVGKDPVNLFAEKPLNGAGNDVEKALRETVNEPEETEIEQTGNVVKNLQGMDTYSENGELSTGKVTTESQDKGFDQYY